MFIKMLVKVFAILCFVIHGTISMGQSLRIEVKDVLDLGSYSKPQVTTIQIGDKLSVETQFVVKTWNGVAGFESKDINFIVNIYKTNVNSYLVYFRKQTFDAIPEISAEYAAVLKSESWKSKTKFTDSLQGVNGSAGHKQVNLISLEN